VAAFFCFEVLVLLIFPEQSATAPRTRFGFDPADAGLIIDRKVKLMFCPQCGTESTTGQSYCRSCGTNLKVIGKAVTLGDAISKTEGVPAKVKEIMSNIKIAHVTDEVSRAMDRMNSEITRSTVEHRRRSRERKKRTAAERRERYLIRGAVKLFGGAGLTTFL